MQNVTCMFCGKEIYYQKPQDEKEEALVARKTDEHFCKNSPECQAVADKITKDCVDVMERETEKDLKAFGVELPKEE